MVLVSKRSPRGPLLVLVLAGLLASGACSPGEPPAPPAPAGRPAGPGPDTQPDSGIEKRARAALGPLKKRLMGELTAALAEGPVHAIGACRLRAQEIPAELAQEGIEVGRTSHRLRNPVNAPEPWMEPLLAAYVADPSHRVAHTVVIDGGMAGYVEPITVQPMCLACHGASVSPAVERELAKLYPVDEATGFEAGEFRGMFWVKVPIKPPVE